MLGVDFNSIIHIQLDAYLFSIRNHSFCISPNIEKLSTKACVLCNGNSNSPITFSDSVVLYVSLQPQFVVSCLCLEDQRSLLLQLKSSLKALDSRKLMSWNQSIGCCEWSGVTCDDEGHVIGLDLSGEYISGGFDNSSSIFSLQHLLNLNLADNYFYSVIPFEFNKLENLTYLNLSNAHFVGQIPSEISHMTRLVTLDISWNNLLKLEKPNLGDLVRNLTNIRRLYLDGVTISAKGEEWNAALLQIPSLQELSMSSCDLSGPLASSLTRLENLSVICLDHNNFSSPVPETFANLKNLTTLSLEDCGLTGMFPQKIFQVPTLSFIDISDNEDLNGFFPEFPLNAYLQNLIVIGTSFSGPLPNSIGNLRNLPTLDLSESQFNGTLPNALSNLTQLVELDLSSNRFQGSIPSLTLCEKMEWLFLHHNYLTGEIPSTHFEGLANLVFIDLSDNRLEGHIPTSLFQLRQLDVLKLSSNKFSGTIDLNMISKLGNLTTLHLSNNNLSIIDATTSKSDFPLFPILGSVSLASCNLTTFPQFLKNQSRLQYLDLSNNHIAGLVPKWIANLEDLSHLNLSYNYLIDWEEPLLNNMSNLDVLDVHSNQLQGPLPALPLLVRSIDYSSNNLSSFIPPNIGNYLLSIKFLSLSSNNLNGNIPESICNAMFLEALDLSNNSLTGTIPKCLIARSTGTLAVLDLARNKLNGTIDIFPGTCDLTSLHLNDNSLQGKIPKYMANCAKLQVLDLGNNQIHDHFPCWLKSISTLRVLILRSNKLHGSLKCQVAWPLLQIIDLASNNFSGRIPMSFFGNWKAMMTDENYAGLSKPDHLQFEGTRDIYYQDRVTITSKQQQMLLMKILTIFTAIDLSCNKFEGLIPEKLGKLNVLHILNLSHNVFSGHIPSSLGNLKNLESLDLSSNKLSEEIPTQLASLSFLEFLNLSYNHLKGRIPTGTQIQSFEATSFKGNDGLYGPPLTQNCSGDGVQRTSPPSSSSNTDKENSIDWNFISSELGFTFGIGIVVLPLIFCRSWRIWYWERVENMLNHIFPQLDWVYEYHRGKGYKTLSWVRY